MRLPRASNGRLPVSAGLAFADLLMVLAALVFYGKTSVTVAGGEVVSEWDPGGRPASSG